MNSKANSAALRSMPTQSVESSVVPNPLFVTSISGEPAADSGKLNILVDCLREELGLDAGSTIKIIECKSSGQSSLLLRLWNNLTKNISFLRALTYALPRCSSFHLFHATSTRFLTFTLPAIMLGRFFGKRIILHYLSERVELDFERISETYSAALKLCDKIVVSTRYAQAQLSGYDINAELVRMPVALLDRAEEIDYNLQPNIIMIRPYEIYANLTCALKAFKLVKMKYPRAQMTIAGGGSRYLYLQRFIENNQILGVELLHSTSTQTNNELMLKADLYLNSSAADSLPYSMLTAMALGIPIVSTDVGGINEVITDHQSGLLVRSNDHVAIASGIIELIEHPELVEELSTSAALTVKKYSWDNLSASWLSLIN